MTTKTLTLASATRATVGTVKATLADAAKAMNTGLMTIALRDNGSKVNGTLVFVDGAAGCEVGDVFNAIRAEGGVYGPHIVLGTLNYVIEGDEVKISKMDAMYDVTIADKAALFVVQ